MKNNAHVFLWYNSILPFDYCSGVYRKTFFLNLNVSVTRYEQQTYDNFILLAKYI